MKRPILAALALAAAAAAPATASAASIGLNDAGAIAYKARTGEVNAVSMYATIGGGSDLRMAFFEYRSRLTVGNGCVAGFPTICGRVDQAFPVDVSLGDKGDVANVNSFTQVLSLDAGSGDDDVLAGGLDATAEGGSGNDTIRVAANNAARGNGGSGRDRISGGLGAAAAILDGGSGADLLVPEGVLFNDVKGAGGDDQLVIFSGRQISLAGGDDDDVLLVAGADGPARLDGGADDDIVVSRAGDATVDAGGGNDVVVVQGGTAPDSVVCGSGVDVVWLDEGDTAAADCELKLRSAVPGLRKVASAESAARALLEHQPDPSKR